MASMLNSCLRLRAVVFSSLVFAIPIILCYDIAPCNEVGLTYTLLPRTIARAIEFTRVVILFAFLI